LVGFSRLFFLGVWLNCIPFLNTHNRVKIVPHILGTQFAILQEHHVNILQKQCIRNAFSVKDTFNKTRVSILMRTNKCTNNPRTIHLNRNDYKKALSIQIKKEVSKFCKLKYRTLWRSGTKDGIKVFNEFKWTNALEEIKIFCPMLVSAIICIITS